jgi:hypothetical protein
MSSSTPHLAARTPHLTYIDIDFICFRKPCFTPPPLQRLSCRSPIVSRDGPTTSAEQNNPSHHHPHPPPLTLRCSTPPPTPRTMLRLLLLLLAAATQVSPFTFVPSACVSLRPPLFLPLRSSPDPPPPASPLDSPPTDASLLPPGLQLRQKLEGTSLYLVGMMGSGKSAVSRELASALGTYSALDTDAVIEQLLPPPQTIKTFFEQEGERGQNRRAPGAAGAGERASEASGRAKRAQRRRVLPRRERASEGREGAPSAAKVGSLREDTPPAAEVGLLLRCGERPPEPPPQPARRPPPPLFLR